MRPSDSRQPDRRATALRSAGATTDGWLAGATLPCACVCLSAPRRCSADWPFIPCLAGRLARDGTSFTCLRSIYMGRYSVLRTHTHNYVAPAGALRSLLPRGPAVGSPPAVVVAAVRRAGRKEGRGSARVPCISRSADNSSAVAGGATVSGCDDVSGTRRPKCGEPGMMPKRLSETTGIRR